jgi:hypothetical protein
MTATSDTIEIPQEELFDITSLGEGFGVQSKTDSYNLSEENVIKFLDYPEFILNDEKVDRNRADQWVEHLASEMLKGTFLWEQVTLVLCKLEGNDFYYRLNGNHTCWAVLVALQNGLPPKQNRPVRVMRYWAKTENDMRRLYASLDAGKPRSQANKIAAFLAGNEEFPGYSKGDLRVLAQGLGVWLWEKSDERSKHQADDRSYLLLKDHHKTALQVGTVLNGVAPREIKHLRRAPVVGAMFETFKKSPEKAKEFWNDVRDGLGITEKDDPRHVLRTWLLQTSLQKASSANGDNKDANQEGMYRACVYLWNSVAEWQEDQAYSGRNRSTPSRSQITQKPNSHTRRIRHAVF